MNIYCPVKHDSTTACPKHATTLLLYQKSKFDLATSPNIMSKVQYMSKQHGIYTPKMSKKCHSM